jgi:hypothetical protein
MSQAGLLPVGTLDPPGEALSPVFWDFFAAESFPLSQGEIHDVLGGDA